MTGSGAGITVRSPLPGDLAAVIRLESASFTDPWTDDALAQELAPDRLRLPLIAEAEGSVVGYLMAWKIVDQLHILNIAADPALRRRGIGTALLRAVAVRAAALGLSELTLEVRASNKAALAFYRRHGFRRTGVRPGYYEDNGEDAVIMTGRTAAVLPG